MNTLNNSYHLGYEDSFNRGFQLGYSDGMADGLNQSRPTPLINYPVTKLGKRNTRFRVGDVVRGVLQDGRHTFGIYRVESVTVDGEPATGYLLNAYGHPYRGMSATRFMSGGFPNIDHWEHHVAE